MLHIRFSNKEINAVALYLKEKDSEILFYYNAGLWKCILPTDFFFPLTES